MRFPRLSAFLASVLLAACATDTSQTAASSAVARDQNAGTWRAWTLAAGKEMRLPPPPDAAATAAELDQLRGLAAQRDAAALADIRYWGVWSPSYRWNEMLIDRSGANPAPGGTPMRQFAMLNIALHDAMIAAWDSKYAYNRPRPAAAGGLPTVIPTPASPSYPCEVSAAAGAASAVMAHLFPKDAARLTAAAEEAARSRVLAGVAFPSDTAAGLALGRRVAARVIEQMKLSDAKWTGTIPTGAGMWKGTDPVGVNDVGWKLFVLAAPNQFRPKPPPAHDSPERAAELAEVKAFKRTPFTNAKAHYWQFGQLGQPGITMRLSEEVTRRLAEEGGHDSAPRAARAYALVHVAHYEGWIASQDAKFHYWTARPNQFDTSLTTVIPTPPFPSYPSNAATLVSASAEVLKYLFPRERTRYEDWVKEFGESRLWAGIHFRSDIDAGTEIGRQSGAAVVARARADGS